MTASDRIRNKRTELGMTQEELAKKLGYKSRSSINKVETSRDLSLKKVKEFAEALGCTPSYLMGWEDIDEERFSEESAHMVSKMRNDQQLFEMMKILSSMKQEDRKPMYDMLQLINNKKFDIEVTKGE